MPPVFRSRLIRGFPAPPAIGPGIGRAEGQVIRLAMLVALLDKSEFIGAIHLSDGTGVLEILR
jgi:hypothetical protein